jgi:hypothetical protein
MYLGEQMIRLTNDLGTPTLHNIQTIRIQRREAEQLCDTLQKHHQDRKCDSANSFLHTPSIYNHACGDHTTEEDDTTPQAIFSFAVTSFLNVLLDNAIGVTSAEKGAEKVATPRCDVEESRLQGRGELEARVEDVADGR